ncbi:potassium channel SKOR-like isoform X2 [Coffea eugenioides]|uniref:potassium channel SKOR-like isoform X2 n=1 Tax=Coffea eugenioides TaxID=49369 RepID=UPI000F6048A6|nr:potassium channel SKOR-like isoform X2 [Coffea eugenioides]
MEMQSSSGIGRGGKSAESEDEEFEVEDLQEPTESTWKNYFRLIWNCSGVLDQSINSRSGNGREITTRGRGHSHGFVIEPNNRWYQLWTHFILLWAVYSSFFTPLEFAFFRGLPENLFLLDIAGQFAFLIDIVVRFFVAYRQPHSHCMVYSHSRIAIRYLKSQFMLDLLGCFPWDYIYKASGRKEPVRYLLWIRLSRALRVTDFFKKLEKDIRINYLFARIINLFVVELYCTHTAACIFYYLATTLPPSEEGYTWIGSLQMGSYKYTHFREIDLWTRYITSLYFAVVTMVTVGYGDIHAVNTKEMIFVMIYVSFDMILGAYLLGNMTALIVKGSKTERFRDAMADLISFMNRNRLGKDLRMEIERHVRLQYESGYTSASALQDLPVSIRTKVSQKSYEPYIRKVPLLKGCSDEIINHMALNVHEEFFLPGELIIEQGSMADQLYFVCHGKLDEVRRYENEREEPLLSLETHSTFGEVSVLCNVPIPYTIRVVQLCRLLRIDKQHFLDILDTYFLDGRIIINNLLEGKESNIENIIKESKTTLHIAKHESELAMKLNCATYDGDLYRLRCFIGAGADPNMSDYNDRSPLHVAARKGYEDIAQFLIEKDANVNAKDYFGNTPLLEAVRNEHDEVASLLVNAGATLMLDHVGTFLCEAVASRELEFLKRLLFNGANPNAKNFDMRTPLHIAASEGLYPASVSLLEAGASVLSVDRWGKTPVDEARVGGNKSLINLLENAKRAQLSEFSESFERNQGSVIIEQEQRKCTVFPSHPWDNLDGRRTGVVLWVPQNMDDLIRTAKEQLKVYNGSCILSENGGKILDVRMISDNQNLFLVNEAS